MKKSNKNKFGKTSIHSMTRMTQISEYGFNEILPNILMLDEDMKKIKKKKQNNTKQANSKQINKKLKRGKQ